MKTFIQWHTVWLGGEADARDVLDEFEADGEDHVPATAMDLIVAYYSYEDYAGSAFVVYRDGRDGKLYEVHGSHCSCNGLEGQWHPELVEPSEILRRPSYVYHEDGVNAVIREVLIDTLGGDVHAAR
jgi:hypothetical protein